MLGLVEQETAQLELELVPAVQSPECWSEQDGVALVAGVDGRDCDCGHDCDCHSLGLVERGRLDVEVGLQLPSRLHFGIGLLISPMHRQHPFSRL